MYPSATFHFYEIFCILKFLLIKFVKFFNRDQILLIKISRYNCFCKNEKLHKDLTCGVVDLRSSDALRRETENDYAQ